MSFEPWVWESENWGGDPEGPLAKALERARNQKPKPLKLIKLPHKDQTSLTEFKEKGIKLKKDSCCCGATKKDPCECMYNGDKCNANNPMCACYKSQEKSKGHMSFAESFEAQATKIDWETDGQEVDLPKTVEVPDDLDADEIADYLSDKYDFLVNTFQIKDAEEGYMADWEGSPYSSWDDAWSDDVNFPSVENKEKPWLKNLTTIGVLAGAIYIGRKIKGV